MMIKIIDAENKISLMIVQMMRMTMIFMMMTLVMIIKVMTKNDVAIFLFGSDI